MTYLGSGQPAVAGPLLDLMLIGDLPDGRPAVRQVRLHRHGDQLTPGQTRQLDRPVAARPEDDVPLAAPTGQCPPKKRGVDKRCVADGDHDGRRPGQHALCMPHHGSPGPGIVSDSG